MTKYIIKKRTQTDETDTLKTNAANVKYSTHRLYIEVNKKYPEYYETVDKLIKEFNIQLGTTEEDEFLQLIEHTVNTYVKQHGTRPPVEDFEKLLRRNVYRSSIWKKRNETVDYSYKEPVSLTKEDIENIRYLYLYTSSRLFDLAEENKVIDDNLIGIKEDIQTWVKYYYMQLSDKTPAERKKIVKSKLSDLFKRLKTCTQLDELHRELRKLEIPENQERMSIRM